MENKDRLSFNLKAKKKCDAKGMILHCENPKARKKSDNITYPENSHLNISSPNIYQKYERLTNQIEEHKGKKIQKNSNHYLEGVLAFPEHLVNEMGMDKFRAEAPALIEKYMDEIKDKYGFEPCGFSLHFDEGHKGEQGGLNIHAHLSFVNYDFKQNKARFREIQRKYVSKRKVPNMAFVEMQDMAGKVFEPLGFKRGISKQITGLEHKDKTEFVEQKLQEANEKIEKLQTEIKDLKDIKKDEVNACIVAQNDTFREQSTARAVKNTKDQMTLDIDLMKIDKDDLTSQNESLREENKELKNEQKSIKKQFKKWFDAGLNYIKTSIAGFGGEPEAKATLDAEPKQIDEAEANEFYDLLSESSGNDEIKKQRRKRRRSAGMTMQPPPPQ